LHNQEGDGAVEFDSPGAKPPAAVPNDTVEVLGALPIEYGLIQFVVVTEVPRYSSSLNTSAKARTKSQRGFKISEPTIVWLLSLISPLLLSFFKRYFVDQHIFLPKS
jgi:hypothetical protein